MVRKRGFWDFLIVVVLLYSLRAAAPRIDFYLTGVLNIFNGKDVAQ